MVQLNNECVYYVINTYRSEKKANGKRAARRWDVCNVCLYATTAATTMLSLMRRSLYAQEKTCPSQWVLLQSLSRPPQQHQQHQQQAQVKSHQLSIGLSSSQLSRYAPRAASRDFLVCTFLTKPKPLAGNARNLGKLSESEKERERARESLSHWARILASH